MSSQYLIKWPFGRCYINIRDRSHIYKISRPCNSIATLFMAWSAYVLTTRKASFLYQRSFYTLSPWNFAPPPKTIQDYFFIYQVTPILYFFSCLFCHSFSHDMKNTHPVSLPRKWIQLVRRKIILNSWDFGWILVAYYEKLQNFIFYWAYRYY